MSTAGNSGFDKPSGLVRDHADGFCSASTGKERKKKQQQQKHDQLYEVIIAYFCNFTALKTMSNIQNIFVLSKHFKDKDKI